MKKKLLTTLLIASACTLLAFPACAPQTGGNGNTDVTGGNGGTEENGGSDGGHQCSFENYVSDNNATCDRDGTKTAHCTRTGCTKTDTVTDKDSKLGHKFTSYIPDGNATCDSDGTKTAVCDRDGCTEKDTLPDEGSAGHKYAKGWSKNDDFHWHAAICECGRAPIDKIAHSFTDGADCVCGQPYEADTGLTFDLNYGGESYTLMGLGKFEGAVLDIPDEYRGKPVTEIAAIAFHGCKQLTELTIPDSIAVAGGFADCTNLRKVTLGSGVTIIDSNAFSGCTALEEINFPESLTEIGSEAFYGCEKLPSITIGGDKLEKIGSSAFYNCTFSEVSLPASVTEMGANAFGNCPIVTATLPACASLAGCGTLKTLNIRFGLLIPEKAYYNCEKLESVTIEKGSTSLSAPKGAIGGEAFAHCPELTSVTIGDGFESMGDYVFAYSNYIETLILPSTLKSAGCLFADTYPESLLTREMQKTDYTGIYIKSASSYTYYKYLLECKNKDVTSVTVKYTSIIGTLAFLDCVNLTSVTISKKVTCIGQAAFMNTAVSKFTYEGTKEQWEASDKREDWDFGLTSYTVKCTNGTITVQY